MQLFKVIWVLVLELVDYPARLGSQLSSGFSYSTTSPLKDQYSLPPAVKPCVNSPDRRDCWYDHYNIHTDYEKHVPHTGVTNYVGVEAAIRVQKLLMKLVHFGNLKRPMARRWIQGRFHAYQWIVPWPHHQRKLGRSF